MVTYDDVSAAHERIRPYVVRTPVLSAAAIDERVGARVFFKCENLQNMGAFKSRGAFNALLRLSDDEKRRGVLAFSSGNHAQAIALAGKVLGIKTVIVMPDNAPKVKLEGTRSHGAEIVIYGKNETREAVAEKIQRERNMVLIPPFNHPDIIAGQGTTAKELIEDTGPLDALLVPCGGAGLLSGCAIAAKRLAPACKVIGVEPEKGNDVFLSFKSGKIVKIDIPDTIADGARTQAPGDITFALVQKHVDDMLTVSDDELLRGMFYLWDKLKVIVEPTGALAFASLLFKKMSFSKSQKIGVVLSGGNVDLHWAGAQIVKHQDR